MATTRQSQFSDLSSSLRVRLKEQVAYIKSFEYVTAGDPPEYKQKREEKLRRIQLLINLVDKFTPESIPALDSSEAKLSPVRQNSIDAVNGKIASLFAEINSNLPSYLDGTNNGVEENILYLHFYLLHEQRIKFLIAYSNSTYQPAPKRTVSFVTGVTLVTQPHKQATDEKKFSPDALLSRYLPWIPTPFPPTQTKILQDSILRLDKIFMQLVPIYANGASAQNLLDSIDVAVKNYLYLNNSNYKTIFGFKTFADGLIAFEKTLESKIEEYNKLVAPLQKEAEKKAAEEKELAARAQKEAEKKVAEEKEIAARRQKEAEKKAAEEKEQEQRESELKSLSFPPAQFQVISSSILRKQTIYNASELKKLIDNHTQKAKSIMRLITEYKKQNEKIEAKLSNLQAAFAKISQLEDETPIEVPSSSFDALICLNGIITDENILQFDKCLDTLLAWAEIIYNATKTTVTQDREQVIALILQLDTAVAALKPPSKSIERRKIRTLQKVLNILTLKLPQKADEGFEVHPIEFAENKIAITSKDLDTILKWTVDSTLSFGIETTRKSTEEIINGAKYKIPEHKVEPSKSEEAPNRVKPSNSEAALLQRLLEKNPTPPSSPSPREIKRMEGIRNNSVIQPKAESLCNETKETKESEKQETVVEKQKIEEKEQNSTPASLSARQSVQSELGETKRSPQSILEVKTSPSTLQKVINFFSRLPQLFKSCIKTICGLLSSCFGLCGSESSQMSEADRSYSDSDYEQEDDSVHSRSRTSISMGAEHQDFADPGQDSGLSSGSESEAETDDEQDERKANSKNNSKLSTDFISEALGNDAKLSSKQNVPAEQSFNAATTSKDSPKKEENVGIITAEHETQFMNPQTLADALKNFGITKVSSPQLKTSEHPLTQQHQVKTDCTHTRGEFTQRHQARKERLKRPRRNLAF